MKTIIKYFIATLSVISISGCSGCSHSGRINVVKQAKIEAKKTPKIPVPNTIRKDNIPEIENIEDLVTPSEQKIINSDLEKDKIESVIGKLIQVEGLVFKEVRELTISLNTGNSQLEQIIKMKEHVRKNWHYIYDPATDHDTWRSAEATIALKYKNKYPGDCDDYSILLASFARQIGLRSRVVGGFDGDTGHAFAEFQVDESQIGRAHV